jgi:hypothetical protein
MGETWLAERFFSLDSGEDKFYKLTSGGPAYLCEIRPLWNVFLPSPGCLLWIRHIKSPRPGFPLFCTCKSAVAAGADGNNNYYCRVAASVASKHLTMYNSWALTLFGIVFSAPRSDEGAP